MKKRLVLMILVVLGIVGVMTASASACDVGPCKPPTNGTFHPAGVKCTANLPIFFD